jgi:hypothetical protein
MSGMRGFEAGAGEGNRTLVVSLGNWHENGLTMRVCGTFNFRKRDFEQTI